MARGVKSHPELEVEDSNDWSKLQELCTGPNLIRTDVRSLRTSRRTSSTVPGTVEAIRRGGCARARPASAGPGGPERHTSSTVPGTVEPTRRGGGVRARHACARPGGLRA